MPDFPQPERRSTLVPILVAIVAIAAAVLIGIHFFPATALNIVHLKTDVVETHTVYKTDTKVVGVLPETQDILYIATSLRVENQHRGPISLDGYSLTFTNPDGAQLVVKAIEKGDIPSVEQTFPQLTPYLSKAMLRDTEVEAGQSATGTLVFPLQVPKAMWDARKSAVIQVDVYHQPSLYLTIP